MNKRRKYLIFFKRLTKTISFTALGIILLLVGLLFAIRSPKVQTWAVNKASAYLSEKLHYPISVKYVDINWFDKIILEGLEVNDTHNGKMISVGYAKVDLNFLNLIYGKVVIDKISLANGKVEVFRYSDGGINISDFVAAIQDLSASSDTSATQSAPFVIEAVNVENMLFSYHDFRKEKITYGYDYYHFALTDISADATKLKFFKDTVQINVHRLSTNDRQTKLNVHQLITLFTFTKRNMEFKDLYAEIGESIVKDYVRFDYNTIDDLGDFNEKIVMTGNIKQSVVTSRNLSHFAPDLQDYNDIYTLSGKFKGKVINFSVSNFDFQFGNRSRMKGKTKFDGLPELDKTFMDLNFKETDITAADIQQYVGDDAANFLKKLGKIKGHGIFTGFLNDFVAKGNFTTGLGVVESDINLKIQENTNPKAHYKGSLITKSFNLGKLVGYENKVQLLDMEGTVEGKGFTLDDAEVFINGKVHRIGVNNYNYKNITTTATLSKQFFSGAIAIKDSNIVLSVNGEVDLNKHNNHFNIQANLEKANLKALNLSPIETFVKTEADFNFTGMTLDEIFGKAIFRNSYLVYKNKEVFLDSMQIISSKTDSIRNFSVKSDLASIQAEGNFNFTTFASNIETLWKEYEMTARNKKSELDKYYANKKQIYDKYHLDFKINLTDINAILAIYLPKLYLSPGVKIEGDFTSGYSSILNLYTKIDTLYYNEYELLKTEAQVSASKLADSSNVLAMFFVKSDEQILKSFTPTKNLLVEGIWNGTRVNFTSQIAQKGSSNSAKLAGNLDFNENYRVINLNDNSFLNLLNKKWTIDPSNSISFNSEKVLFENFTVSNNKQTVSLDGTLSQEPSDEAFLKVIDFQLETINPLLTDVSLKGVLTGSVNIHDIFNNPNLGSSLFINNFHVNNFLVGNIIGTSSWNTEKSVLDLDVEVERLSNIIINIKGNIQPGKNGESEKLNLIAELDKADLDLLNPIFKGVISEVSGKITGDFTIGGSLKNIVLKGTGDVQNGKFKVDYLGTTYYFSDNVYFDENLIGFKRLKLKDSEGNNAVLDGGIFHDNFRKFVVNLKGYLNNVCVLNTTEKDNELFYGKAMVSGNLEILGAFSDLKITANARSQKGTDIHIPMTEYSTVEEQSYITFTTSKSKAAINKETVDLSGITLDFNFDMTPDANIEIIFDKKAGDKLRGNGSGNIKMSIDTRGDFNMFGNYRIKTGTYNFSLANIISKEFNLLPNSSISWTGDPYKGLLDIRAAYRQNVSLAPLIDTGRVRKNPEFKTRYPVDVLMGIEGDLMSPRINLDVDILKSDPKMVEDVIEFESKIKTNEQELNKQVFSLLILKSFSAQDGSFNGIGGSGGNLSELLSNQLSSWLSQLDKNLQVDIDLNAMNTFMLRFSYTMLEGRLRISRDGSYQNTQSNNQNNFSSIAGEWTIEYLLSQDGRLRLKLYNKNNNNALLNSVASNNINNTSAGFSIMHTQGFNNLKELFGKKEKPKRDTITFDLEEERKKFEQELAEEKKREQEEEEKKNNNTLNTTATPHRKEDEAEAE
ncbi:MAG: translocation/assembly module TamB [Sporocytophaga sp.]|uniref:translocation/assembly module TamB domain-containing protein n=1 Tax=Sporocytophaga sp. TaxID=2231183 RepID=UPI001B0B2805|nr:translocation/assembly module TamB domain-containing protein [Sporocytophaga sp.]MBO9701155.1 translocation/assembly module TamB [Sporocytophaga sp.]